MFKVYYPLRSLALFQALATEVAGTRDLFCASAVYQHCIFCGFHSTCTFTMGYNSVNFCSTRFSLCDFLPFHCPVHNPRNLFHPPLPALILQLMLSLLISHACDPLVRFGRSLSQKCKTCSLCFTFSCRSFLYPDILFHLLFLF